MQRQSLIPYDTFHSLYGFGDMSGPGRSRFMILFDGDVFIAVDILSCYWSNGFITPSHWREYPDLELAIHTTIIRGAGAL